MLSLHHLEAGIKPEGCSTYTWEKWYGKEFFDFMITESGTADCNYAKKHGFVDEIVAGGPTELVARAVEVAASWIGKERKIIAEGISHILSTIQPSAA